MGVLTDLVKKIPKLRAAVATVALTAVGGVLGWLGTSTLKNLEEIERMAVESRARIERLENDDAKWGTLAEQQKQLVQLAIEVEVLKRLFSLPGQRQEAPKATETNLSGPRPALPPPAPPGPPAALNMPPVEQNDLEKYRSIQKSKFPEQRAK